MRQAGTTVNSKQSATRVYRARAGAAFTVAFAVLAIAAPALAQNAGGDSYDRRDFSGVWVKPTGGRGPAAQAADAADTRPESTWSQHELPFTDAGREAFLANVPTGGPRQVMSTVSHNDPRDAGNPLGLYRALQYSGNGRYMQFIHAEGMVVQLLSVDRVWRIVYVDGRPVPEYHPTGPFWYGYTVGHWEGDTLVATTISLDERAWLDSWGTPISMEARVEERWERTGPDELTFTITVIDPEFYTEPWTSMPFTFARQRKGIEPFEIISAPIDISFYNEEILAPSAQQQADR